MGFEDLFEDLVTAAPLQDHGAGAAKCTSVFHRLSTGPCDARLELSEEVKKKLSFMWLGIATRMLYRFTLLENKNQSRIKIPLKLAQEAMRTHHATLIGYFLGPRLHFPVVQS
ncbi:LOW QUALITY PROTEIN: hypothetical protein OSB04_011460 [Centaurea solstitialis]|uniref:Uncharacterized protein n=1 Tax=Centaurea solstitialis TaxID=347529 RepID=A0AA38TML2_9ASTR|nr:LOW QUALITY PROTEIN: hypothetical protein OSB04_011460 [Centaurea solstitialis]